MPGQTAQSLITPSETTKSYAYSPDYPLAYDLRTKDIGQSDIIILVTISGVNATVSTKSNGNYTPSLTQNILLNARTDWGSNTFYARPNPDVTSFSVTISGMTYVDSYKNVDSISSLVVYTVVSQTTWTPLYPQTLTYVRSGEAANAYSLQT